jgi:hypothetical protein
MCSTRWRPQGVPRVGPQMHSAGGPQGGHRLCERGGQHNRIQWGGNHIGNNI